jgi:hypothetical protein
MPRKTTQASGTAGVRKQKSSFAETPRGTADRMFRAAMECIRQRERYARLVASGAPDLEQLAVLRVVAVCDEILSEAMVAYEKLAGDAQPGHDEWRRQANALWHASREYCRRQVARDGKPVPSSASRGSKLQKLAMEYDLEASTLLAMKLALGGFRQICPDCELESRPQSFVA